MKTAMRSENRGKRNDRQLSTLDAVFLNNQFVLIIPDNAVLAGR